jgi:alkylation response protein AidB-like acyl-CoA dehydrogenase
MNIFGLNPVVVYGTEEQKARMLPPIAAGKEKACFAVTEPDAGLETAKLATRAERRGDIYVINGAKIWISTAQVADKMLILARTTPLAEGPKPAAGLSLFYTALDRRFVEVREIEKMGRHAVDSNQLFIDGLEVPAADRIGEEGRGFEYILPSWPQSGAHSGRGRSDRPRPRRAQPRHGLCQTARRVRPADRKESGDPASARAMLYGTRSRRSDDAQSGLAI